MTGRERVLRAYRHEEPDRTPIGEMYDIAPPTREVVLGRPCGFVERMEILHEAEWQTIVEMEARDTIDIAQKLGFDMIGVKPNISPKFERPYPISKYKWLWEDTIYEYLPESGITRTDRKPVAREKKKSEKERLIEQTKNPPPEPEFYVFRRVKELMKERGVDLAIFSPAYGTDARSSEILEWFCTQPGKLRGHYDKNTQNVISNGRKLIAMGADIIGLGGDLACDKGPMISPKSYREFIMPQIGAQADALHEVGAFVNNTTDGNIWPIIDDFLIGTHVDGYGEIDKAAGMELARLKKEYGERICFVGNLDVRWSLTRGTPQDCKKEMIQCIEDGWGSGGHVICTSNIVHKDVQPKNYLAALDAYHEYFNC